MTKETVAEAIEASTPAEPAQPVSAPVATPVDAQEITGLPTQEATPTRATGTVADLLAHKKGTTKPEVKPEDAAKDKKLDEVDKKLQEMLFRGKPRKEVVKEEVDESEVPATAEVPTETAPVKTPAKPAPAKKPAARDRATELRERELELERDKLALDRERLELEKSKTKQGPTKDLPASDISALSSDERYELEIFQVMAKEGKYADLPGRFTEVAKATAKYKSEWEKDNAGESFNPDDSAHDSFFAKNQVEYDKRDFRRAEHCLATEGQNDPKMEKLEKSNQELLAREKLREIEPKATEVWLRHADAMVEAIDPDIVKAARDGGPEKMVKDFPDESEEIIKAANALRVISTEAHKLLDGDGLFAPQAGNRAHERILDIIRHQERIIPTQPRESRLDPDGREFATWEKWVTLTSGQQANYWHMGPDEIVDIVSHEMAGRVKYELERSEKIGASRLKRKSGGSKPVNNEPEIKETRSPSASPGTASKTTVDTPAKTATPADDKFAKIIRSALFKRPS